MPSNIFSSKSSTKSADSASILTTSSTSSRTALLKSKLFPSKTDREAMTPAQKQAERRAARINTEILATQMSLRS
ncbi:hypothetical protein H2203_008499 [Taxawa tesnikishii (nom. ined.)]|nr:hypothetical protein H2203_008499 [Dothideales sp. JES 119]